MHDILGNALYMSTSPKYFCPVLWMAHAEVFVANLLVFNLLVVNNLVGGRLRFPFAAPAHVCVKLPNCPT